MDADTKETFIRIVVVSEQEPLEATNVYVVGVVGVSIKTGLVCELFSQVYVLPPDAVSVTVPPAHRLVADAVMLAVGAVVILMVTLAVSEHPLELVTVTAYPVCTRGVTRMAETFCPLLHEYDVPPDAVSVKLLPEQIV
jgi:hypothetical protein